jgi:CRP/FNR family cyclic AMP-dependent transcriptional regulator
MSIKKSQKVALLRRAEIFSDVSSRALGLIADAAAEAEFPEGAYIVRQGEVGTGFYMIASGSVRVVRGGRVLATLGPGDFFGELSVLDHSPRMAHVIAAAPTECLALPSWDFMKLLEKNPKIALSVLKVLARRIREMAQKPQH